MKRTAHSRIDDVLSTVDPWPQANAAQANDESLETSQTSQHTTTIDTEDLIHTDHDGLNWKCPYSLLHMLPPPPLIDTLDDTGTKKLKTPMSNADREKLKAALEQSLEMELAALNKEIQHVFQMQATQDHADDNENHYHVSGFPWSRAILCTV